MKVDNVEFCREVHHLVERNEMVRQSVDATGIRAQRPGTGWNESGGGPRIFAGGKGNGMGKLYQTFRGGGKYTFGFAIMLGRHAFIERGNLCNPQNVSSNSAINARIILKKPPSTARGEAIPSMAQRAGRHYRY